MLYRRKPDSDFASQFAFAVSLTGQSMILFAIVRQMEADIRGISLVTVMVQAILFVFIGNFLHRVWCAMSGGLAAILALSAFALYPIVPGLLALAVGAVWLNEFRWPRHAAAARALGYGLVLVTLFLVHTPPDFWIWTAAISAEQMAPAVGLNAWRWISTGLIGATLLWRAWEFLNRRAVAPATRTGIAMLGVAFLLATLSYKAPGIGISCMILVIGFANGNRVLTGLGIVALLTYLSQYYYLMQVSLLEKSLWLLGTGAVLLLARGLLAWVWPSSEDSGHA